MPERFEYKPISAREAIATELVDLEVPDGREIVLDDPAYRQYVVNIRIDSFDDLQVIGLIPRGLDEAQVRKAIQADDDRVYALAEQHLCQAGRMRQCACGEAHEAADAAAPTLENTFKAIRRHYHPDLAAVLSEHTGKAVDRHRGIVQVVRGWVRRVDNTLASLSIEAVFTLDIHIGENSVLRLGSLQHSLMARNIYIHALGKLVTGTSYTKIWANAVLRKGEPVVGPAVSTDIIPWKL